MNHTTTNNKIPIVAILAHNSLMGIGLRNILEQMLPFAIFKVCDNFSQLESLEQAEIIHLFVSANEVVEHSAFFEPLRRKCIVLTTGTAHSQMLSNYRQINVEQDEAGLHTSLKALHSAAHHSHPTPAPASEEAEILSRREIEVLRLIVEGKLNKEISAELNISLATVISHRKNIVSKLGIRSVAGLTIYAVMKRYIQL